MTLASTLVSRTIGRVAPGYRTCREWSAVYLQIIDVRQITEHTKANRRCALQHLLNELGDERIGSIKPLRVGKLIRGISTRSPQTAKRVLFEARDFFNEAILEGWIDHNPAAAIKPPLVRILRHRLSFDHWRRIRAWSVSNQPPWVQRMLDLALVTGQRRSDIAVMGGANVWDRLLHVEQIKTGTRIALPLDLRLEVLGKTVGDVLEDCVGYAAPGATFVRRKSGAALVDASLSARFEEAREGAGLTWDSGNPPSLHECRSLSERLYRAQGIDTKTLLGHKHQSMTDIYNDDRGLNGKQWQVLQLPAAVH